MEFHHIIILVYQVAPELWLPFTGPSVYILAYTRLISRHRAGVRLYTQCFHFAKPCGFNNQLSPSL
uniref:hypothetical protein n=1 Tax=Monoraphidium dybowskii TaxID=81818 RepID=UPI0022FD6D6D|nr:hypothetical protein OQ218_mgp10 [Monoraphidium dybowskii]WBP66177.1 prot_sesc [Chlorolobion braunii]